MTYFEGEVLEILSLLKMAKGGDSKRMPGKVLHPGTTKLEI